MKLFSEKVNPTFTSSTLNILTVKNFNEVFFDVYEFEINGKTFTAEKVADHNGSPVVDIPIVIGEKEFLAPFILKRGQFLVEFNERNTTYIGSTIVDLPEPDIQIVEEKIDTTEQLPDLFLEQITKTTKTSKMLFDQEVEVTNTNIDHNILVVENYKEVFFDLYEVEINNKIYNTEKISSYKSRPVVNIPIIFEGKEYIAPFVLERGQQEVFFNKNNTQFVKEVKEEKIKLPEIEEESNWSEEIVLEKKEEIIQDVVKARKLAREYAENIKRVKIEEADSFITKKEEKVNALLESTRDELTKEFLSIIDKTANNLKEESKLSNENLSDYVTSFVIKESKKLSKDVELLNENNVKYFEGKIQDLVENIYTNNLTKLINEKDSSNVLKYSKLYKDTKTNLEQLLEKNNLTNNNLIKSFKNKIDSSITILEKSNVNLEDKFEKGLNKALSRVGNVKNVITKEVDNKLKLTENKIADIYEAALSEVNLQIEKRVEEVSFIDDKIEDLKKSTKTVLADTNLNIDIVNKDIDDLKSQKNVLSEKIDEGQRLLDKSEERLKLLTKQSSRESKDIIKDEVSKLREYNNNSVKKIAETIKDTNKNIFKTIQENKISFTSLLEDRLEDTNNTITSLLEDKLNTVDNKFKEHLKFKIKESKNSLLKEVDELRKSFSEQVIIEKLQLPEENQDIDIQDIKEDLEKKISLKFTNELTAIRRYLDSYGGGGGSVAKQFANGGTMEGNLDVTGHILSGGINLLNVLSATGGSEGTVEGVIAGLGLTGGGTSGTVTVNVSAGDGVDATANCLTVDSTVVRTTGAQSIGGAKTLTDDLTISSSLSSNETITTQTIHVSSTTNGFISAGRDLADIFAPTSKIINTTGCADFCAIDTFSAACQSSTKYIMAVKNTGGGGGAQFSEINITTDGGNIGIVEYGINSTREDGVVEYGAICSSGIVSLTAKGLVGSMADFTFNGNRVNLFS